MQGDEPVVHRAVSDRDDLSFAIAGGGKGDGQGHKIEQTLADTVRGRAAGESLMRGEPFGAGAFSDFDSIGRYGWRVRKIEIERARFILCAETARDELFFQRRMIVGTNAEIGRQAVSAVDGLTMTDLLDKIIDAGADDVHGIGTARVAFGEADQPAVVENLF